MDAPDAAHAFGTLFPEVYRHFYRRRDPREARTSGEALALLQHLQDSGPLTIGEAARHFDRSQASISERVERLIEQGLVTRLADERDRRRHLVWISAAGEALVAREAQVLSDELLERAFARLDAAVRAELVEGLRALLTTTRDAADEAAGDDR